MRDAGSSAPGIELARTVRVRASGVQSGGHAARGRQPLGSTTIVTSGVMPE